jgi:hypothetical protein
LACCCECGDEPSGSGATDSVGSNTFSQKCLLMPLNAHLLSSLSFIIKMPTANCFTSVDNDVGVPFMFCTYFPARFADKSRPVTYELLLLYGELPAA